MIVAEKTQPVGDTYVKNLLSILYYLCSKKNRHAGGFCQMHDKPDSVLPMDCHMANPRVVNIINLHPMLPLGVMPSTRPLLGTCQWGPI